MIRRAHSGDTAAIDAFLAPQANTSMFLRANIADHGFDEAQARQGMTVYVAENKGEIYGVFARSNAGFVMAQGPREDGGFWDMLRRKMAGQVVAGMTGAPAMVAQIKAALGLQTARFSLDALEDLYRLELADLEEVQAEIRAPGVDDLGLLGDWIYEYDTTTLGAPKGAAARAQAGAKAAQALENGRTRLLIEGARPVAKTSFVAQIPDMVQVGGVYTPPALRGRGHARRLLGAHLGEARRIGVQSAVLFTSAASAARAYRAIGFERVGQYALSILARPMKTGAPA